MFLDTIMYKDDSYSFDLDLIMGSWSFCSFFKFPWHCYNFKAFTWEEILATEVCLTVLCDTRKGNFKEIYISDFLRVPCFMKMLDCDCAAKKKKIILII